MARVQVGYDPRPEALQTTASANIQTEQARFDPRASAAFQLAEAFGAATPAIDKLRAQTDEQNKAEARAFANSMPVAELGKKLKDGTLLASQSPAYVAMAQHVYGENLNRNLREETASSIARGALRFEGEGAGAKVEEYLSSKRSELMAGQSEYTAAGFDKNYGNFRDSIISANTQKMDAEFKAAAVAGASTSLINSFESSAGKPSVERAAAVIEHYNKLWSTGILMQEPEEAKAALKGVLSSASVKGDKEFVAAFTSTKLSNGSTVTELLGTDHTQALVNHTDTVFNKNAHIRVNKEIEPFAVSATDGQLDRKAFDVWRKLPANVDVISYQSAMAIINADEAARTKLQNMNSKYAAQATSDSSHAAVNQAVAAALDVGAFSHLPAMKVVSPTGVVTDANLNDVATDILRQRQQAARDSGSPWSPEREMLEWSRNNVVNPEMKNRIVGGLMNLASLGWGKTGEPTGKLNEVGKAGLEEFMRINSVNPEYAAKLIGNSKDLETLSSIQMMVAVGGSSDIEEATRWVIEGNRKGLDPKDYQGKLAKLDSAADQVFNPAFFGGTASWMRGFFGNDVPNLTQIKSQIRSRSEVLIKAGMEPEVALQSTVQYLADPKRSVKINNVLYSRHDLPEVPQGEDIGYWMERYKTQVAQATAKSQHLDGKNIVLHPTSTGTFLVLNNGELLTDKDNRRIEISKQDFSTWVGGQIDADKLKVQTEANLDREHPKFQKRIEAELKELQKKDKYALEHYDTHAGSPVFNKNIFNRNAFAQIQKDGNERKPLSELFKIYKEKGK